ncbi:MAG: hypothetical protein DRO87_03580 [Candidatus Thorarchaeota archaeon]|nr:MAG: hypothetical protein DRO87_03580 [Candidatus Thorarchaeota archaeon]
MVDYVEYDADWGFIIDPTTLTMQSLHGKAPVGSIILTKAKETVEAGFDVVVTKYFVAKKTGVEALGGKKDASVILADLALKIMKETGEMPADITVKKEYSNGNVDLVFTASDYDKFVLKFTPKMTACPVMDFLDTLNEPSRREFNPVESWRVERAKSGRATCRTCRGKIEKDTLRIGEPSFFQEHKSWKWHHLACVADDIWGIPEEKLEGYEELDSDEQNVVRETIWS